MRSDRITSCLSAVLVAAAALGLAGCTGNNSVGPSGNSITEVRGFNALQGCPANVDIGQANVAPTFTNLSYGAAPSGYTSVRAGVGLHYGVFTTGQSSPALAAANVDLNPHDPTGNPSAGVYTLVGAGVCNPGSGMPAPRLVRLQDAFPSSFTGVNSGTVALRVVNLVPDQSGGITLASNGLAIHGSDDPGTNNVVYAGNGGTDTSRYNGGINPATNTALTIRNSSNAVIATVPNFTFQPNHAYTLFVIGEVNPTPGGHAVSVVPVLDF